MLQIVIFTVYEWSTARASFVCKVECTVGCSFQKRAGWEFFYRQNAIGFYRQPMGGSIGRRTAWH